MPNVTIKNALNEQKHAKFEFKEEKFKADTRNNYSITKNTKCIK